MTAALVSFQPLAEERGVRLAFPETFPEATVFCDSDRVLQVLANVVDNALKFTPPEGLITVTCLVEAQQVRFSVEDSGPGIAEDELPHVFERYWQGSAAGIDSRGLGLYIAKGIIEAGGGTLSVESEPGRGATFHFTLPIEPRAKGSNERADAPLIVIVEDDAMLRETMQLVLESEHYRVMPAANGREALEMLAAQHPHPALILLDLQMPIMDGSRTIAELRRDPQLANTPIVVVSGDESREREVASLGVADFIKKPLDGDRLVQVVAHYVGSGEPG